MLHGARESRQIFPSPLVPLEPADGAHVVMPVGTGGEIPRGSMKGEKAEGLSHFRDSKYEGPYGLSLLILTIDQSD